ncbi:MAG TPA: NAD(P)-dependent oxidoreductase [Mycobacteriales bacterium]|jgi:3-hydroxyisobutyrate dehydrogenase-like beta-hydroxyacid dehydrogenase|nr:NAD(P)-dependent oxidoreductase [Mycobacteriales bacterium]
MPVGFVGLGNIGAAMASRVPHAALLVHDVREEAAAPFVQNGARFGSLKDLAVECDVISIVVRTDDQVRDVVTELADHAAAGTVIAIHSTIDTRTAPELAAAAAAKRVEVVDAAISGGPVGAAEGRLAVMVGGERAAFDKAKPAFSHWADLVLHVGPVGAGTQCKLARNLISFVSYAAGGEAQRLAAAAGIDVGKLAAVVRHTEALGVGSPASLMRGTVEPLAADDPARPIFEHGCALGEKDLSLAIAMGEDLGLDVPLARHALGALGYAFGVPREERA